MVRLDGAGRAAYIGVLGAALAYLAAFGGTGALRAVYPYPIDGIEPGSLDAIDRIMSGQAIYGPPSLDYVPMIYGPLYFYASAAVAAVTGSDLMGLRLVAWVSSIGAIALLALLVRFETGSTGMALVGGGLLAACAPLVVGAMDVGRTDATSLVLLLGSIYAARRALASKQSGMLAAVLSGALMAAALLTKMSGLPVAVALVVLFVVLRRGVIVPYVAALLVTALVGLAPLFVQSGTWSLYYMWVLPREHDILPELLPRFWGQVLERFTVPILIGPFYLVSRTIARDRTRVLFYALVALSMIAMSLGVAGDRLAADATSICQRWRPFHARRARAPRDPGPPGRSVEVHARGARLRAGGDDRAVRDPGL